MGEVAPPRNRARWISVIFIMSSLGALLGIWLGLVPDQTVGALAAFLVAAAIVARFSTSTRGRHYEQVSP